eukprot:Partr_v1_DN26356_c2_g1_i1_m43476 putative Glycerol-3-Phosphate DeHydrogenase
MIKLIFHNLHSRPGPRRNFHTIAMTPAAGKTLEFAINKRMIAPPPSIAARHRIDPKNKSPQTIINHLMPAVPRREKVCIVGSGNWGSVIAKIIGNNVRASPQQFDEQVKMWVYEELIDGRKLTEIINTRHENVKYLPGVELPSNVLAVPDVVDAAADASILVFVVPHQFVKGICDKLNGKIRADAKAVSLIKGVDVGMGGLVLISDIIRDSLSIDVSVLMGANIAGEVAKEQFCETTIGYRVPENGRLLKQIFNTSYFKCSIIDDVVSVELCGALKNIVGVAAGIVDGLQLGDNTKAAIIRIGLMEMRHFCKTFYAGVKDETFFESCGVADLITTCYGGRNRKVAEAHVITGKSFEELEKEMLNGQKLQGTLTAKEVHEILVGKKLAHEFPLFASVYRIVYEGMPAADLPKCL